MYIYRILLNVSLNFEFRLFFLFTTREIPRPHISRETRKFERMKSDLSGRSSVSSKRKYAVEHGQ